jgi:hypothetical protein
MDITLVLITLLSVLTAAVMTGFAWRLAQEERRREQARVDALAAEIHRGEDWSLGDVEERAVDVTLRADLFNDTRSDRTPARGNVRVAIALLVAAGVAAFAGVGLLRARGTAAATIHAAPSIAPASGQRSPLELTALTHERDGDRLIVRAMVLSPASRSGVDPLTAVVTLFNNVGEPIRTIETAPLAPGSRAPFVVSIPNASNVARYRISFKTNGVVIAHVDRRGPAPMPAKQP